MGREDALNCTAGRADQDLSDLEDPALNQQQRIDFIFVIEPDEQGSRCMRIPRISATQSTGRLPLIPSEACHVDHGKVATPSRRGLPPSERSDAGWYIISLNWLCLSTSPAVCAWILLSR